MVLLAMVIDSSALPPTRALFYFFVLLSRFCHLQWPLPVTMSGPRTQLQSFLGSVFEWAAGSCSRWVGIPSPRTPVCKEVLAPPSPVIVSCMPSVLWWLAWPHPWCAFVSVCACLLCVVPAFSG
jgi:hypothetical protein